MYNSSIVKQKEKLMTKVMYPTNRPFADRVSKKTAYKINRNTKFYKTLLDFDLAQLPVVEVIVESHCFYTNKQINFKGTYQELLNDFDAWRVARGLVEANDRYNEGPIKVSDWTNGNMITMFFSNNSESRNEKFLVVWEAA